MCEVQIVDRSATNISRALGIENPTEMVKDILEILDTVPDYASGLEEVVRRYRAQGCNRLLYAVFLYGQAYHGLMELAAAAAARVFRVASLLPQDANLGGHN